MIFVMRHEDIEIYFIEPYAKRTEIKYNDGRTSEDFYLLVKVVVIIQALLLC